MSSINRVLRNISAKEKVMKRKSKCWEGVREKSLQVKQEEVKAGSVTRGEDCRQSQSLDGSGSMRVL